MGETRICFVGTSQPIVRAYRALVDRLTNGARCADWTWSGTLGHNQPRTRVVVTRINCAEGELGADFVVEAKIVTDLDNAVIQQDGSRIVLPMDDQYRAKMATAGDVATLLISNITPAA